jgi:hypothetical protein
VLNSLGREIMDTGSAATMNEGSSSSGVKRGMVISALIPYNQSAGVRSPEPSFWILLYKYGGLSDRLNIILEALE